MEPWFCDDLDCYPPYGPACADCRPKCAQLSEALFEKESVSTYRPDSPGDMRPMKSKDNLFDPDVYLDEEEEVKEEKEEGNTKRWGKFIEYEEDRLTPRELGQIRENDPTSTEFKNSLEKSRHYLQYHRWSIADIGNKWKELKAVAGRTPSQQPQSEITHTSVIQEEGSPPHTYTRLPEVDASEAATQYLYQSLEHSSAIIEDVYNDPFPNLIQPEELDDEGVMDGTNPESLHQWLQGLAEGAFAADESDGTSSTRTSLYGPLALGEDYAESRPCSPIPDPAIEQVDEAVRCRYCKLFFVQCFDPAALHVMKCEFAYKEAARMRLTGEIRRGEVAG